MFKNLLRVVILLMIVIPVIAKADFSVQSCRNAQTIATEIEYFKNLGMNVLVSREVNNTSHQGTHQYNNILESVIGALNRVNSISNSNRDFQSNQRISIHEMANCIISIIR